MFVYLAGNIFVLEDGQIGLIDFGQVKQISGRSRETLCRTMIALADRRDGVAEDAELVGKMATELGVEIRETAKPEAAAAIGIWLFDGLADELPGGYDTGELSPNSPVKELKSFPQDLVLVGRSSILIKALSNRLGVPWSLAKEWAPIAHRVLENNYGPVPISTGAAGRVRFREVWNTFKQWTVGRAGRIVRKLPSPIRSRFASILVRLQDMKVRRKLTARRK